MIDSFQIADQSKFFCLLCFPLDVQRLGQLAKVPRVPGDVSDADNADDDDRDDDGGGDDDNDDDVNDDALGQPAKVPGDEDHHDLYDDVPSRAIHIQEHRTFNVQYSTESE